MDEPIHPIEGQIVLLAGAKASISLTRLSALLAEVQQYLVRNWDVFDRQFERIEGDGEYTYYLASAGHWETVGEELGLDDREIDAIRRTHEEQFEREGRRTDREQEFEASLEIRDVFVIGPSAS